MCAGWAELPSLLSATPAAVGATERRLELGSRPGEEVHYCHCHWCRRSLEACCGPLMWLMVVCDLGLGFRGGLPEEDCSQVSGHWLKPSVGPGRIKFRDRATHFLWLPAWSAGTGKGTGERLCRNTCQHYIMCFIFHLCLLLNIAECQRSSRHFYGQQYSFFLHFCVSMMAASSILRRFCALVVHILRN